MSEVLVAPAGDPFPLPKTGEFVPFLPLTGSATVMISDEEWYLCREGSVQENCRHACFIDTEISNAETAYFSLLGNLFEITKLIRR
jgi:hypothetical protein